MAKFHGDLDRTFSALADPTRRAIIGRLCSGPASVGELSEPFDIALPTLLKHVRVLEKSGLVSTRKVGRVRTCRVEPGALQASDDWLRPVGPIAVRAGIKNELLSRSGIIHH